MAYLSLVWLMLALGFVDSVDVWSRDAICVVSFCLFDACFISDLGFRMPGFGIYGFGLGSGNSCGWECELSLPMCGVANVVFPDLGSGESECELRLATAVLLFRMHGLPRVHRHHGNFKLLFRVLG